MCAISWTASADEPAKKAAEPATQTVSPPSAPAAEKAPNFTLPNAQAGMTRVKWPREKPVFLTFGEQASQAAIQAWSTRMKERFGEELEFVGVAWLQSLPESMHPAAEAVIKASHPDVLMDKSGSCATRFGCQAGAVNAYVIAPDGTILLRIHEGLTEERFAKVRELLAPYIHIEK
jgi:hypothetical protein